MKTGLEKVLKTYLEDVLKTLWRHTKFLLGISVSKKSIFHKSISNNSKANQKCINFEPNNFTIPLILEFKQNLNLGIKISDDWFDVVKSAEFKFEIAEKVRQ